MREAPVELFSMAGSIVNREKCSSDRNPLVFSSVRPRPGYARGRVAFGIPQAPLYSSGHVLDPVIPPEWRPPLQARLLREPASARVGRGTCLKTILVLVGLFVGFEALLWLLDFLR